MKSLLVCDGSSPAGKTPIHQNNADYLIDPDTIIDINFVFILKMKGYVLCRIKVLVHMFTK
ncbi:hypothetical protein DPMN_052677 [Dreissena polymorpha]|uniref:Uncharacterized protein n=1 Tax=Dreissena polymorpha TaxID=45954 RepID=A0A9D4HN79_DREPO|nr:hypothetical protein DPMN_052677 [Dreissena polymorpha]